MSLMSASHDALDNSAAQSECRRRFRGPRRQEALMPHGSHHTLASATVVSQWTRSLQLSQAAAKLGRHLLPAGPTHAFFEDLVQTAQPLEASPLKVVLAASAPAARPAAWTAGLVAAAAAE